MDAARFTTLLSALFRFLLASACGGSSTQRVSYSFAGADDYVVLQRTEPPASSFDGYLHFHVLDHIEVGLLDRAL